jgi:hypothetical protein
MYAIEWRRKEYPTMFYKIFKDGSSCFSSRKEGELRLFKTRSGVLNYIEEHKFEGAEIFITNNKNKKNCDI